MRLVYVASDEDMMGLTDLDNLAEHGHIWIEVKRTENPTPGNAMLGWYKSLATGHEALWYDHEIQQVEEQDDE